MPNIRSDDLVAFVERAQAAGLVDAETASALSALAQVPTPEDTAPPPPPPLTLAEEADRERARRHAEAEVRRAEALDAARTARDAETARRAARKSERHREKAAEIGLVEALFTGASGGLDGVLEIVVEADDSPGGRLRDEFLPVVYENVGWFVGAVLVLTGSIYGLREAWTTFGPLGRHASVAGALFVYHTLFVMLSALLARRSVLAGQFLAGIGACLVPLAYVAVANLSAVNPAVGGAVALGLTAGCVWTLRGVGRRFAVPSGLAEGVLLASCTLLAYPHLPGASPARLALPALALLGPWFITRSEAARGSLGAFALALYAALSSEIFALTSSATEITDALPGLAWRTGGVFFGAGLAAYLAVLGGLLGSTRRLQPSTDTKRKLLVSLGWLGLALSTTAGISATSTALGADTPDRIALVLALVAVGTAVVQSLWLYRRHRGAFFLLLSLVSLFSAVACRLVATAPESAPLWGLAALAAPLALLVLERGSSAGWAQKAVTAAWAAVVVAVLYGVESPAASGLYPYTLGAVAGLAAACHAQRRPIWHGLGALWVFCGWILCTQMQVGGPAARYGTVALCALAAIYLVVGALRNRAKSVESGASSEAAAPHPFDDISMVGFLAAALMAFRGVDLGGTSPEALLPVLAASLGLLARGILDRSALPGGVGALALGLAAVALAGAPTPGAGAAALGAATLASFAAAAVLTPSVRPAVLGRRAFGRFELPWGWSGRGAIGQGFGLAGAVLFLCALADGVLWFGQPARDASGLAPYGLADRELAIQGGVLAIGACLLVFSTRALATFGLRGRAAVLWLMAAVVGLTAVTNRIGRPLAPEVVARNLTIVGVALYFAALGVRRFGPKLAEKLDAPAGEGGRYHAIAFTGVLALATLLCVDVNLLTPLPLYRGLLIVPPLMLLGPALLLTLLGRAWRRPALLPFIGGLMAMGAAVVAAQGHVLGPALSPLVPPGGRWVPQGTFDAIADAQGDSWLDLRRYFAGVDPATIFDALAGLFGWALTGLAATATLWTALAVLARFSRRAELALAGLIWNRREAEETEEAGLLAMSCGLGAALLIAAVATAGVFTTAVPASLLAVAAAVLLLLRPKSAAGARGRTWRWGPLPVSVALTLHTFAQAEPTVPVWAGPAFGLVALGVALAAHATLPSAKSRASHLVRFHIVSGALALLGVLYAAAVGGPNAPLSEGSTTLANAAIGLTQPLLSPVPSLMAVLLGMTAAMVAASWGAIALTLPTRLAVHTATLALLSALGLAVAWKLGPGVSTASVALVLAGGASALALLSHVLQGALRNTGPELSAALQQARDADLLATGVLLTTGLSLAQAGPMPPELAVDCGAVALGLAFVVSLHTLVSERRPLHVYLAEACLVGAYGFVRAVRWQGLTPAQDALALLGLGFLLIGVTVFTRRRGEGALADASRRFAACLPLLAAAGLPWQADGQTALLALGACGLYATLGWVERSRILGTAGAVAANLALLALALSEGLTGAWVYLAPLGIVTLMTVHLFADRMDRSVRLFLRFAGTALTYAPAGLALVLQIGDARSDTYPLGFAAACVFGIAAGMFFHVRAYLVLGLGFLLLDLATALVRASLADQRLGFFVLSLAGLSIIGGMVLYTLRKEAVLARLARLRRALGTWD